ncbi:hypothetical protein JW926_06940 [Candidatus Sumerlaeota bacterium]|nr:hypothetical protein [Candidatus Sumerlaeota bacterium]
MKRNRKPQSSMLNASLNKSLRYCCLLLLCLPLILGSGCAKERAKLHLNKARKLLTQAEQREAERLEKENYDSTKSQIESADNLLMDKKYKQALSSASSARDKASKLLENTRSKLAAQRLNEAKISLDVTDRNNGVQEDQERYKKIKDLYNKALEKQRKNKWDDVINLCEEEMREVDTLLRRLQDQAKQKQMAALAKFDEMKAAGAQDYAPDSVIAVQDMLRTLDKHINEDRDYLGAINLADDTIRKCEEGVTATKEKIAREQIAKIEIGLSDATDKGALVYAPELLKDCNEAFDALLLQYQEKKYDNVIDTAKILTPKVERLIYTTRKKSSEVKIETVSKEIATLDKGGARQYLPGRVEKIVEFYDNAMKKHEEESFEEAEDECLKGLREAEKTHAAFNDLALEAMRNAAESLEISRNVFDESGDIFMIRADIPLTGLDLTFEQAKETMRGELEDTLNECRLNLGIAKLRQEEGGYRKAIEIAGSVKQSAEYVLNETYHVVAHNVIMELANQITKREADGAREYAPVELDRTKNLLEKTKEILAQGNYREAVRKGSETRAQLELTTQELAQRAVENMNAARKEIEEASQYRTAEFQKTELEQAQKLLNEAQQALDVQKLKAAVETALEAARVARAASQKSSQLWCEQVLGEAEAAIADSEEAGSLNYAAEELDEAKRFHLSAQNLYNGENYLEAKDVAARSAQKARDARYKKIITAETAINEAKSYNGWKYRYALLSQAIVDAKMARQFMEKKNYFSSSTFAEKAALEAREVVRESQKAAFRERIANISSDMDKALNSGANYYQTDEIKKIYQQLADIQEEFHVDKFDYLSARLDKIEADLEHLIAATPEVLEKILAEQRDRLAAQKETDAVDYAPDLMQEAEQYLRYSKIDFDNRKFTQSYRDLRKAMSSLNEVERRINMNSYAEKSGEILDDLNNALNAFDEVLSLGPDALTLFTQDVSGKGQYISMAGRMRPEEFRNTVTQLYHKANQMEVPRDAGNLHKDFVDMLNDIRVASLYFEKLIILDEYKPETRREFIDKAFDLIEKAKEKRSILHETFINQEVNMRLANLP